VRFVSEHFWGIVLGVILAEVLRRRSGTKAGG
jgi:hypothetical protein